MRGLREVAATTVSPLAHGDSRRSEFVIGWAGVCVLTGGSLAWISSPTIVNELIRRR